EDGIRDDLVTGVQTCALPICRGAFNGWITWAQATASRPAINPQLLANPCPRCWSVRTRSTRGGTMNVLIVSDIHANWPALSAVEIGRASCRGRGVGGDAAITG